MRNTYLVVGIIVVLLVIISFAAVRNRLPQIGRLNTITPTPITTLEENKASIAIDVHTPASTAVVDSAVFVDPGYIAIHENQNGEAGQVIGVSNLLASGKHENVVITLSRKTADGEKLIALLHKDNGDGIFEFPGPDEPTKDNDGRTIMAQFNVSAGSSGFQIPATGLGENDN